MKYPIDPMKYLKYFYICNIPWDIYKLHVCLKMEYTVPQFAAIFMEHLMRSLVFRGDHKS